MFDVISTKLFEGDPANDELSFKENQLIEVTESIDENNYLGQYTIPGTNEVRSGKFPRSYVEILSENIDDNLESPKVPELSIRDRIASMLKQQEAETRLSEQHSGLEGSDTGQDTETEQRKSPVSELSKQESAEELVNPGNNTDDNNETTETAKKQSLIERMARLSGAGRHGASGFNPFGMPVPVPLKSSTQEHVEPVHEDEKEDIEDLSKKKQFNIMTGEWMDVDTFKHSFKSEKSESTEENEVSPVNDIQSKADLSPKNSEVAKSDEEISSDAENLPNDSKAKDIELNEKPVDETAHVEPEIHPVTEGKGLKPPPVPVTTTNVLDDAKSIPKPGPVYTVPDVPRAMDATSHTSTNPPPIPALPGKAKAAPPPIPIMTAPSSTKLPPIIPTPSAPVLTPSVETVNDHYKSSEEPTTYIVSEKTVSPATLKIPKNMTPPPPIPPNVKPSQSKDVSISPTIFKAPPPIPSSLPKVQSEAIEEKTLTSSGSLKEEDLSLRKERLIMNSSFANTKDKDSPDSQSRLFFEDSKSKSELEATLRKNYKNACLLNVSNENEWLLEDGVVPESAIVSVDGKLQKYAVQKEIHNIGLDIIGEALSIVAMRILLEDYSYLDVKLLFDKKKKEIEWSKQTFVVSHTKDQGFLEGLAPLALTLEKEAMANVGNKTQYVDSVRWVDDLLQRNNFVEVLGERTFGANILKYDPHKGKLNVETKIELGDILVIKDGDYVDGKLESLVICNVDDKNYSFKCITIDANGEVIIVGRNFSNMTKGKVRVFRPVPRNVL
ncbi:unnamed protein product [Hanseniaspora opuntiae]